MLYPKKPSIRSAPTIKEGLSEDYNSFEFLWSTIETKVRCLMTDLQEPVIKEMTDREMEC